MVANYIGNFLDQDSYDFRIENLTRSTGLRRTPYMLQLPDVKYLDARHYGGPGRFINHSCLHNCHMIVRRLHKNRYVVFIQALKGIRKRRALSTVYGWTYYRDVLLMKLTFYVGPMCTVSVYVEYRKTI